MKLKTVVILGAVGVWAVFTAPIYAQNAKILSFDAPGADTTPNDYNGTIATGINNLGMIVGYYNDSGYVSHGFLRSPGGTFTSFDAPGAVTTPGSYGTIINNINDFGEVTGNYGDSSGVVHGFIRSPDGKFTTFDAPDAGGYTNPIAINLEGAVVGDYVDSNGQYHAFSRTPNGKTASFDGPAACETGTGAGCFGSAAFNINIFGLIAAAYEDDSGNFVNHVFLRGPDGRDTVIKASEAGTGPYQGTGCPGCALGLNASGAVAGIYTDTNGVLHGFLRYPNGTNTTFDVPGAGTASGQGTGCPSDCSTGLNDFGEIIGNYVDANYVYHGFFRNPGGHSTGFDPSGSVATFPSNINELGMSTGYYLDASNVWHGFVRMPSRAR